MNAWSPTSPCGPGCLPVAVPGSRTARLRRAVRLLVRGTALLVVLVAGLLAALVVPLLGPSATAVVQRVWAAAVLSACGVRVRHTGPAAPSGALVVANHVSWLDVFALHAVAPVRMLAKTEVRRWPVLGIMAARAGTVFLDRDRLRDLPGAVAGLADALRAGTPIGVFAEGTTRCGRDLGPFRPAAFQAAYDAGAPVVPVAVRYGRLTAERGTVDATAAFIGDDTLAASLLRVLAVGDVVVDVTTCAVVDTTALPPGPARASARRALARGCADAVAAVLPPDPVGHPAARRTVTPLPTTRDLEHVA
ncbi:lysophospholipid acyltransferase family protein [Actinomycetospora lemnae]|uniref:1-acyl-sn-glycerol-3-phosphate acyltransferase n=1 Tax=Actinomycetospora lemnae TaxID=3019891 RepID=A0ABT5T2U3_9PSEU|nr:1-acylglycerol-3-phosphate O-acyltransferase [Actinomycetospora sp. DW7H6]MDD7969449.1 1-acylglycerol-3-phosphate O-acyltransferase [Actinomycetospora sp. DW7H6]